MKLTTAQRNALPAEDFALPATRRYPIPDKQHAEEALRMMGNEPAKVQMEIKHAVHTRYPDLTGRVITHGKVLGGKTKKRC